MAYFRHKVPNNIDRGVTTFLFDNYYEYLDFIEQKRQEIFNSPTSNAFRIWQTDLTEDGVRKNIRNLGINWFGTLNENEVINEIRQYQLSENLVSELERVQKESVKDFDFNIQQKKQITFTSQEIGIFSFDLASLGLIRVYEYYSDLLKRAVDGNLVRSYQTGNGQMVFYHIFVAEVPEHILEQKSGKLYSPILKTNVERKDAEMKVSDDGSVYWVFPFRKEIPRHDVQRVQKKNENGSPKFTSTWKKSFIYIPIVDKVLPQVDLIFVSSFSYLNTPKTMFWNAVAVNVVMNILSEANMKFRIYSGFAVKWNANTKISGFIKIKDINDGLDANIASILAADARNYRYNKFKCDLCAAFDAGQDLSITKDLGFPINDTEFLKNVLIETLKAKKDFGSSQEDTLNPRTKILLPSATSEQSCMTVIRNAIRQIEGLAIQQP
jgi:hypothetical protein